MNRLKYHYKLGERNTSADLRMLSAELFLSQIRALTTAVRNGAIFYELEADTSSEDCRSQFTTLRNSVQIVDDDSALYSAVRIAIGSAVGAVIGMAIASVLFS